MKRSAALAAVIGSAVVFTAARLAATPGAGIILSGTGETSLRQEQAALKAARIQSEQARDRSRRFEQQATAARDEAEQARRRAAAMAARIQQAEAVFRQRRRASPSSPGCNAPRRRASPPGRSRSSA